MSEKLKGVSKDPKRLRRPYKAVLRINGKLKHLGYFVTQEEAHAAVLAAEQAQLSNPEASTNTVDATGPKNSQ